MRHLTTTGLTPGRSGPPQRGGFAARQAGVTLVELLTVVVIVAILMTIGVPSFRYVTTANRVATESDALLGDLQYARSEAIREGQQVTVCVSKDNANCDTAGSPPSWQEGWIIFSNPDNGNAVVSGKDPLLRAKSGFSSSDTFQSTNSIYAISFSREGFAQLGGTSTTITLHDSTSNQNYTRCLHVSQTGMMIIQTHSSDTTCQ